MAITVDQVLKNLQLRQKESTTVSLVKNDVELSSYGDRIDCKSISLYPGTPVTLAQATIEATKISEMFNIKNLFKTKVMAEVFHEDQWTPKRIKDAVKHVIKTNIYNTFEKGIEPGVILGFDRRMKLFTQADVMEYNNGTGTHGFSLMKIPGVDRMCDNGNVTDLWYVKSGEV